MYRRVFLNTQDHGGTAFIEAKVARENGECLSAQLTLSDCSRQITLDFDLYDPSEEYLANVVYKARLLKRVVDSFVQEVLDECSGQETKK